MQQNGVGRKRGWGRAEADGLKEKSWITVAGKSAFKITNNCGSLTNRIQIRTNQKVTKLINFI